MTQVIKKIQFDPDFDPISASGIDLSPLIQCEVLSGVEKARRILSRAKRDAVLLRQKAREILAQAVREKEEERKRATQEGYEEGLAQLTDKRVEAALAREQFLNGVESEILRMVLEISEKVIGCEMEKGAVLDVVRKAISESVGQRVVVRIHPSDRVRLKEGEEELRSILDATRSLHVREDESVTPGGCLVETELGVVDARLETQWAAIKKALGVGV